MRTFVTSTGTTYMALEISPAMAATVGYQDATHKLSQSHGYERYARWVRTGGVVRGAPVSGWERYSGVQGHFIVWTNYVAKSVDGWLLT